MLTHSTNTEAEERQREQETGQAQQLAPGALVVLSKTGLRDEPIKFAAKFRRMLLLEHLAALRDIIGSALEAGLAASRARLENLNEFEMISMLGSAIEEGAHMQPTASSYCCKRMLSDSRSRPARRPDR